MPWINYHLCIHKICKGRIVSCTCWIENIYMHFVYELRIILRTWSIRFRLYMMYWLGNKTPPPPNTRSILINCNTGTTIYPILDIIYLNKNKVSTELPGAGGQEKTILLQQNCHVTKDFLKTWEWFLLM